MPQAPTTITGLPSGSPLDGTEPTPFDQSGVTVKIPAAYIKRDRVNPSPVTAAGTNQSNATPLSMNYDTHIIGTVPSGGGTKFVAGGSADVGQKTMIYVRSSAAADLLHYPPASGKFNDFAVNDPIIIERGASLRFIQVSSVDWIVIL